MTTETTGSNKNTNEKDPKKLLGTVMAAAALALCGYVGGHILADTAVVNKPVKEPTYASHGPDGATYYDDQWNRIPTEEQPIPDAGIIVVEGGSAGAGAVVGVVAGDALSRKRAAEKARKEREDERRRKRDLRRARHNH